MSLKLVLDKYELRKLILSDINLAEYNYSSIKDMSNMFMYYTDKIPNLSFLDVSNVTNMNSMFEGTSFNQNINNWDVSNVEDMCSMFKDTPFNHPLNNWNVSNVINMMYMFFNTPFNQPLNNWDVSNVRDMFSTFENSNFNQPLDNWDVSKNSYLSLLFKNSPFNQDISSWNIRSNCYFDSMFENSPFNNIEFLPKNISKPKHIYWIFQTPIKCIELLPTIDMLDTLETNCNLNTFQTKTLKNLIIETEKNAS